MIGTKRHWNYFKYICRHKWFVGIAAIRCHCSVWRAVIHDWHKFLPSEWGPYARTFYNSDGSKRYSESEEFAIAWNMHQKRAKHHWQYWYLTWDRGDSRPVEMPTKYIREMVADWWGAGRTITGQWQALKWYNENSQRMKLSITTRLLVEAILKESSGRFPK